MSTIARFTAFENRRTMQTFVSHIAWESEVWIATPINDGEEFTYRMDAPHV